MRGDPEGLRVHVPDARELLLVQRVSLGLATSAAPGQFFHDRHSSSVRSAQWANSASSCSAGSKASMLWWCLREKMYIS